MFSDVISELIQIISRLLNGMRNQQIKDITKGNIMLDIAIFMDMALELTKKRQRNCCNCLQIKEMKKQRSCWIQQTVFFHHLCVVFSIILFETFVFFSLFEPLCSLVH